MVLWEATLSVGSLQFRLNSHVAKNLVWAHISALALAGSVTWVSLLHLRLLMGKASLVAIIRPEIMQVKGTILWLQPHDIHQMVAITVYKGYDKLLSLPFVN